MAQRLQSGDLRQRITIQSVSKSPDADGQMLETCAESTLVEGVPAKLEGITGTERINGNSVSAQTVIDLRIRYRSGVTTLMRVLYEGKYYEITKVVDPFGDRRELEIQAKITE